MNRYDKLINTICSRRGRGGLRLLSGLMAASTLFARRTQPVWQVTG